MEHDKYREGDLIRAMFSMTDTPEEYERLYLSSASFKSGVDVFARSLIPIFLRGMSIEARGRRDDFREMYEEISRATKVDIDIEGLDVEQAMRALGVDPSTPPEPPT